MYARQLYKQQLAMTALEGRVQRRFFEAVQGDRGRPGQLFGIQNIFAEEIDEELVKQIINRKQVRPTWCLKAYTLETRQERLMLRRCLSALTVFPPQTIVVLACLPVCLSGFVFPFVSPPTHCRMPTG